MNRTRSKTKTTRRRTASKPTTRAQLIFRPPEVRGTAWHQLRGERKWIRDGTLHEEAVRSMAVRIARDAIEGLSMAPADQPVDVDTSSLEAAIMLREAALLCDVLRFLAAEPEGRR